MYCPNCGTLIIERQALFCNKCGHGLSKQNQYEYYADGFDSIRKDEGRRTSKSEQRKSKSVAFLLSFFLGGLGIHRFYVGKIGTGILWLFTGGLFGIGTIVDFVMICLGKFKDKNGNELNNDSNDKIVTRVLLIVTIPIVLAAIIGLCFGIFAISQGDQFLEDSQVSVDNADYSVSIDNNEKQEALLQYINVDIIKMAEIEEKLLASYGSVTGENYTNDLVAYEELTETTSILARKLNDEALSVALNINDEEILAVHKIFIDYSSTFQSALGLMISAIENQDYAQMSNANEKITEGNMLALEYAKELKALADNYNVVFESEI